MKRFLILLSLLLFVASPAMAYKQVVHRAITRRAWVRALPAMSLKSHIGIDATTTIEGRVPRDWAEQGADDEDNGFNSLDHFFDPRHDAGLTIKPFCTSAGITAEQKALTSGTINSACIGTINNDYLFSVIGLTDNERKTAAKDLFQHLGHNIHLLQDMAQPEHTRNDQHLFPLFGNTPASIYEEWGLQHLVGLNPDISYEGYPTVVNDKYQPYFHSDDSAMGFPTGRGLADFANNNFLTQDTNYHDELDPNQCYHYDLPIMPADSAARTETVNEYVWLGGLQVVMPVDEKIYTSSITDFAQNSSESDPFHTFYSSLDLETHQLGQDVFSLGDGSYVTRASMLVPRAVGYSAGMLQRIFRGSMNVDWTETSTGVWKMTVTNTSSEAIGSDARIYASFTHADPPGSSVDHNPITGGKLSDLVPGFSGIPAGQSISIPNLAPALPTGKKLTEFERRIAIQGTLGTGDAVIGLVQPGKPGRPGKLRIEVDWQTPDPTLALGFYVGNVAGQFDVTWSAPSNCGTWYRLDIPNSTISGLGAKPMEFTIDPLPPTETISYYVYLNSCYPAPAVAQNVTVRVFGDDNNTPISTETVFLNSYIVRSFPQQP